MLLKRVYHNHGCPVRRRHFDEATAGILGLRSRVKSNGNLVLDGLRQARSDRARSRGTHLKPSQAGNSVHSPDSSRHSHVAPRASELLPRPRQKVTRLCAVDHDERRSQIVQVAVDLIAREGLEAATIRRIAAEFHGPTKLVTYYFADKHELLLWVYQSLSVSSLRNVSDVIARDPADLVAILFALSPIDEKRINLWKVYLAFWDWAARDPAVTRPHRRQFEIALRRIAQAIETRYGKREDLDSVSERILAIVQGIAIQTLMDQERWPPARVRLRLTEEVNSLLGAG
jgi:TetR/AcrR family transcriptional repressor of bet genes